MAFSSQEDVDFFSHLELHLRQEHPSLGGRDHMAFRGSYYPVRVLLPQGHERGRFRAQKGI